MPHIGPISRKDLIRYLRQIGFEGPYSGGKHEFMIRGSKRLVIPNPHRADVGVGLILRILRQIGIEKTEWEKL